MSEVLEYIPVDFIKAEIINFDVNVLLNNPLLDFESLLNRRTGEISLNQKAVYKNLVFVVFESYRIWLKGSLHIFHNNGEHNYNQYSNSDFKETLDCLLECFKIKPVNLRIMNLEWGFNVVVDFNVNRLLESLIQHRSVSKTTNRDCVTEGHYTQFKHKEYILKIYNKGLQHKLRNEILRVEIKQINFSKYRKKGIVTLQDFIESDKAVFLDELINQWQSVILYDLDLNSKHNKYAIKEYWKYGFKENRRMKKYHFDKLKLLNSTEGRNSIEKVKNLIYNYCNKLQL